VARPFFQEGCFGWLGLPSGAGRCATRWANAFRHASQRLCESFGQCRGIWRLRVNSRHHVLCRLVIEWGRLSLDTEAAQQKTVASIEHSTGSAASALCRMSTCRSVAVRAAILSQSSFMALDQALPYQQLKNLHTRCAQEQAHLPGLAVGAIRRRTGVQHLHHTRRLGWRLARSRRQRKGESSPAAQRGKNACKESDPQQRGRSARFLQGQQRHATVIFFFVFKGTEAQSHAEVRPATLFSTSVGLQCLWPSEGWEACALSEVSGLSVSN